MTDRKFAAIVIFGLVTLAICWCQVSRYRAKDDAKADAAAFVSVSGLLADATAIVSSLTTLVICQNMVRGCQTLDRCFQALNQVVQGFQTVLVRGFASISAVFGAFARTFWPRIEPGAEDEDTNSGPPLTRNTNDGTILSSIPRASILSVLAQISLCLFAANELVTLCQKLRLLDMPEQNLSIKELGRTNEILGRGVADGREIQLVQMAKSICPDTVMRTSIGRLHAWFFYCKNNMVVYMLRGEGYWAYDNVEELFKAVHAFNTLCENLRLENQESLRLVNHENPQLENQENLLVGLVKDRKSTMCFFDLEKSNPLVVSHASFPAYFRNVNVIAPSRAPGALRFDSVLVETGCKARFENVEVQKLRSPGSTHLKQCYVGVPCIFAGDAGDCQKYQNNDISDNVTFCECQAPEILSCDGVKDPKKRAGFYPGGASLYRKISNISNKDWNVRFETTFGNAYHGGQKLGTVRLPAMGSIEAGHTTWQGMVGGTVTFQDHEGNELIYKYNTGHFPNWTIIRPTVHLK